jgi:hypothetical protein
MQAFQIKRLLMVDRTPSRELQEHLWVFPMDYPIKLIGHAGDELRVAVVDILQKHFPEFDGDSVKVQPSRTGKYHCALKSWNRFMPCMLILPPVL